MEEAEQIVIDAKNNLPDFKFHSFEMEFRELLKVPLVHDWPVRSIRIFASILDCDDLTRRLFTLLNSRGGSNNLELVFLESAYLHLDGGTFERVFVQMLQFVVLRLHQHEEKQVVGNCLLEIVRERENLHRMECQLSGVAFTFRFYENFSFFFEMYFTLDFCRYQRLLGMMYEHKSRGSPSNEDEIESLRIKALKVFKPYEYPTLLPKLLNICTRGKVIIFPSSKTDSVTHYVHGILIPEHSLPVSVIPATHNYPVRCASTLDNPITVPIGKNHPVLDYLTADNQKPDSTTTDGQGIRIPERSAPISVTPVTHNYPVGCATTLDNPIPVPIGNNHSVRDHSTADNQKPDSTTTDGGTLGSSFSDPGYT